MRILFFGDVFGKPGREGVCQILPVLKKEFQPDAILANIENLAHGLGIGEAAFQEISHLGFDGFTSGNEVFRRKEGLGLLGNPDRHILRPANYPPGVPGRGAEVLEIGLKKLLVINLLGRTFMTDSVDDPFQIIDQVLADKAKDVDAILVDVHAEASSEKRALGFYLDGRVSAVLGTHTHVPTADAQILPNGTAYITDTGFCGPHGTVIGLSKETIIEQFRTRLRQTHEIPDALGLEIGAVVVDIDIKTKKATSIVPIRRLLPS